MPFRSSCRLLKSFLVISYFYLGVACMAQAAVDSADQIVSMSTAYASTVLPPVYPVTDAASSSIPGQTYSSIVINPGISAITFDQGDTILQGGKDAQLITPFALPESTPKTSPITMGSTSRDLIITLGQGQITGDIQLGTRSSRAVTLLAGEPSIEGIVSITGTISGNGSVSKAGNATIRTNGSTLNVNGDIGTPTNRIMTLEAANGSVTTSHYSSNKNREGMLNAYNVIAREEQKFDIATSAQMNSLFLYNNASFVTNGEFGDVHNTENGGRIDVHNLIDGGKNGLLAPGTSIKSA